MFIRIEDKILNTAFIECVHPERYGGKGLCVWITRGERSTCYTFDNTTMEQFMEMVK